MSQNPQFKHYFEGSVLQEVINYSEEENNTWKYLYATQMDNLQDLAHNKVLECLNELSLPKDRIPQLGEVSEKLYKKSGWQIIKVEDLIRGDQFFQLLVNRMFPSTVYIRGNEELSLSKDPDVFHEIFGHCSILLDTVYAGLFEKFALLGLQVDETQRAFIQRLFWFTFETGLINSQAGVKIYGGSLLSSIKESRYAIKDSKAIKRPFSTIDVFRTPYRADLLQSVYYVIPDFSTLYSVISDVDKIKKDMDIAYELGEFFPPFPIEKQYNKYTSYNICKFVHAVAF